MRDGQRPEMCVFREETQRRRTKGPMGWVPPNLT